jgi:hypothetical protein
MPIRVFNCIAGFEEILVISVNYLDLFLLDQKFYGFDLLCIVVRSDCSKFLTLVLCPFFQVFN